MKNLYWILIVITITIALAEGYALYQIPKAEMIEGQLYYEYPVEIEPGSTFKLSLESRAQGQSKFSILAVFEENDFTNFPQSFNFPVLSSTLSDVGIYQLRAKVLHNHKVLYVNKGLLPLTRDDLSQTILVDMQVPIKPRKKIIIAPKVTATPVPILEEPAIVTPAPVKLDVQNLLGDKLWLLQSKQDNKAHINFDVAKGYVAGSGGCNNFKGGYQVAQSEIKFNQFIASSKYCDGLMEVETYFLQSLTKVTTWLVNEDGKQLSLFDENKQLLLQFMAK